MTQCINNGNLLVTVITYFMNVITASPLACHEPLMNHPWTIYDMARTSCSWVFANMLQSFFVHCSVHDVLFSTYIMWCVVQYLYFVMCCSVLIFCGVSLSADVLFTAYIVWCVVQYLYCDNYVVQYLCCLVLTLCDLVFCKSLIFCLINLVANMEGMYTSWEQVDVASGVL